VVVALVVKLIQVAVLAAALVVTQATAETITLYQRLAAAVQRAAVRTLRHMVGERAAASD
jgi:hypothetical protein